MKKLLTLSDAVSIGIASMLGAGVFVVFGPALSAAGTLLPLAIVLAGLVAYLNAKSISQLASKLTRSGGAYAYGRHYLGPTWGFLAGVAFLVGKIGSAAAISLTFATYINPQRPVLLAILAIFVMAGINILGVNRTAFGSRVLGSITLGFLILLIIFASLAPAATNAAEPGTLGGVFAASSVIFFAFAGYARIATLGSEVKNSSRNIPLAIGICLMVVFATYLILSFLVVDKLGAAGSASLTPLRDLAAASQLEPGSQFVFLFAAVACLGSLLALLAGMSHTAATMAEDSELPRVFRLRLQNGAPWLAELAIGLLAIALVLSTGVLFTIGLSSFCVLAYYAIANLAAFQQPKDETNRPKIWNLLGIFLCITIGLAVPPPAIFTGVLVLAVSLLVRLLLLGPKSSKK